MIDVILECDFCDEKQRFGVHDPFVEIIEIIRMWDWIFKGKDLYCPNCAHLAF